MLCRLSAANAYVAKLFLNKRNTTRFNTARFLLKSILTSRISTPHSANKSGVILCYIKEFLLSGSYACLLGKVCKCSLVKLVMNRLKSLSISSTILSSDTKVF